jgi:hypothetical protein
MRRRQRPMKIADLLKEESGQITLHQWVQLSSSKALLLLIQVLRFLFFFLPSVLKILTPSSYFSFRS